MLRLDRLVARGMQRDDAERRIATQMSDERAPRASPRT